MMESFRNVLSGLYQRFEGELIVFILTLLGVTLGTLFDPFRLGEIVGENYSNLINSSGFSILFFLLYIFSVAAYEAKYIYAEIKVKPSNNIHTSILERPLDGFSHNVGMDITIPNGWELTNCYVNLDKVVHVYHQDGDIWEENFADWFAEKTKPEYKALLWKSPLADKQPCKINIGENSNTETILIAKIIDGNFGKTKIKVLDFCLCGTEKTAFKHHKFGLYKVFMTIYWSRDGIKEKKAINGYIFSDGHQIKFGIGDYRTNLDIPKSPPTKETGENKQSKPKVKKEHQ